MQIWLFPCHTKDIHFGPHNQSIIWLQKKPHQMLKVTNFSLTNTPLQRAKKALNTQR